MEFRFTPGEEQFRHAVRRFLQATLPAGWDDFDETNDEQWQFALEFTHALAHKGWLCPNWPKEYGGAGMTVMEQVVLQEELAYHRAPRINQQGLSMLGPVLILHGSEEQKRRHLPPIANGDTIWTEGYSEPDAGSDLASLQTRAVRDGDHFVLHGQKLWAPEAHRAEWMFLLARTDPTAPKHRGISFFLLEMRTPGITSAPLVNMAGQHRFNQVFFDHVRIPRENLVGELNHGWYIGANLLDFERSNVSGAALARRDLEDLLQFDLQVAVNGRRHAIAPAVRRQLTDRLIETEVGRFISYRIAWMHVRGLVPTCEASTAKLYHSELGQRIAETGVRLMSLHGHLAPGSRWAPLYGHFEQLFLLSMSKTIDGGTSEILRNIIATRGLGLPRG